MKKMLSTDDLFLLSSLESVLGPSVEKSSSNFAFFCPFDPDGLCTVKNKPKLEIRLGKECKGNPWQCWVCGTKGKSISSLMKAVKAPVDVRDSVLKYVTNANVTNIVNDNYEGKGRSDYLLDKIVLPKGFRELNVESTDLQEKRLLHYLHSRGFTKYDIVKYRMGYSNKSGYDDMIIVPSYDSNNKLNYYIGKKIVGKQKPLLPAISKQDVIVFENHINWNLPIILCEGAFDAVAIKRNPAPVLGKFMTKLLLQKIVESPCDDVYVAMDRDALKQAVNICEELIGYGKNLYLIKLEEGYDPAKVGFETFTKRYLHSAKKLTLQTLLKVKLDLIYE